MNVTKQLYQWDTGQKLTECTGIYVDYLIGDEVYRVEITDGTCIIPDELLQTSGRYKVWECMADNTLREFAFKVLPRPIPPNYVFTPTEQLTFEGLVQKETNKFNTNAIEKLNAYNANADNRVAEFNLQTEQIQADVSELKSDIVNIKKEKINFKLGGYAISNNKASYVSNNARVCSDLIPLKNVSSITLPSGFEAFMIVCDENYNVIASNGYYTNVDFILNGFSYQQDKFLILMIRSISSPSEDLTSSLETIVNETIIKKASYGSKLNAKNIIRGYITKVNDVLGIISDEKYITLVAPILTKNISIKSFNGYEFIMRNVTLDRTSDWVTSYDTKTYVDNEIYITIRKSDSSRIVDIDKAFENIVISGEYLVSNPFNIIDNVCRFSVLVNKNLPTLSGEQTVDDTLTEVYDNGILVLPDNYSAFGEPVRLVIVCHGSGADPFDTKEIDVNGKILGDPQRFLNKMGYAVMDMYANPYGFTGSTSCDHYGNPIALQCYIKGYEYVIKHFNVKTDGVFVSGSSMGGLTSFGIVQNTNIPVIAQAGFCPCVDLFKQAFCNPWSSGTSQRRLIATYYGFTGTKPTFTEQKPPTEEETNYFKNNLDKVLGFYPIVNGLSNGKLLDLFNVVPTPSTSVPSDEETLYNGFNKNHKVPLKIWHNKNDEVMNWRYSKYIVQMIKNSGGIAYLRTFETGGHGAWNNGNDVTVKDINGNDVSASASEYECYLWFKRFE